jgi:hypothetical protein
LTALPFGANSRPLAPEPEFGLLNEAASLSLARKPELEAQMLAKGQASELDDETGTHNAAMSPPVVGTSRMSAGEETCP